MGIYDFSYTKQKVFIRSNLILFKNRYLQKIYEYLGSLAEALLDDSRDEDNFMEQVNSIINKPSLALGII